MNIKLRTETGNHFLKEFFKLKNNATLGKTMKNVRQHGNMKLFSVKIKLSQSKMVFRKFIRNRNEYKKIKMSKPVYLYLSLLDISKTAKI